LVQELGNFFALLRARPLRRELSLEPPSYANSGRIDLAQFVWAAMLGSCEPNQEIPMSATEKPAGRGVEPDDSLDEQPPPTPDQDGPHDVPDDKVIEKTLPIAPKPDRGSGAR
jgi:hypothetical protein